MLRTGGWMMMTEVSTYDGARTCDHDMIYKSDYCVRDCLVITHLTLPPSTPCHPRTEALRLWVAAPEGERLRFLRPFYLTSLFVLVLSCLACDCSSTADMFRCRIALIARPFKGLLLRVREAIGF